MTVSVLTLVKGRQAHLRQLVEGLRRSRLQPAELVVVQMDDAPLEPQPPTAFPLRVERLSTGGLPLARARNRAARCAGGDALAFLDVDCIPMADCLGRLVEELDRRDGLLCADVRYLAEGDAPDGWEEGELLARGRAHPVRTFPAMGVRREPEPGLFWSLAFAVRRDTFESLEGFDEAFEGYGAEDTDFGFRAAARGLPLLFVGGAIACHQHHQTCEPPLPHLADIVRNARVFYAKWGRWPMEGWLERFAAMGLIAWTPDTIALKRAPSPAELAAARVGVAGATDRIGVSQVQDAWAQCGISSPAVRRR